MKDDSTRTELMAIPIVAVLFGIGLVLFIASSQGSVGLAVRRSRGTRSRCRADRAVREAQPTPGRRDPCAAGDSRVAPSGRGHGRGIPRPRDRRRELCRARRSPPSSSDHAGGRKIEALVIAPAIGSRLARWTGDESQYVDARKHLDDTVAALAAAGITATGETGADDPLQAADDGVREFGPSEIVFVTKPGTGTDWVERGVIETATARYSVPVTHRELSAG